MHTIRAGHGRNKNGVPLYTQVVMIAAVPVLNWSWSVVVVVVGVACCCCIPF